MFKVKIETIYSERGHGAYAVMQDGVKVAEISGGHGEYYIYMGDKHDINTRPIARFKHHKALANAKDFMKFVLARATVAEVVAGCGKDTPYGWAQKTLGFVCLNARTMQKRAAHRAALMNALLPVATPAF